jgi:tetratricopeptide (TPR) repeat protein
MKMNQRISRLLLVALVGATFPVATASAQKLVRQYIREGNSLYGKEDYLNSELSYRKALEANAADSVAQFNLGNSLFRQEKMDDALKQYAAAAATAEKADNKTMAAEAYYNAGNVCMAGQDYAKALELYKHSLRLNPADDEARYNMVLASKLLKQQENQDNQDQQNQDQQQNQQDQQQQQQQDQNQDQKDQNQDQQQQPQNQDQQQQDQQQDQQQRSGNISPEQAEAILNAANQEEKNVQDKVKAKLMEQVDRKRTDKDW